MRARSQVVIAAIAVTAALAGCAIEQVTYKPEEPVEDCEVVGDEDGNGVADCGDPACAAMPACRPVCGNGIPESGEACDDGDLEDGDGCDRNCTVTDCGNGVVTADEVCDDGDRSSADACDAECRPTVCGNGIRTALEQCDDGNTSDGDGCNGSCVVTNITYLKASNTGLGDLFGSSVALSGDGSTLAVGARFEDSVATGIDGDESGDAALTSGAVYVFLRTGETWGRQGYVKASNTGEGDQFGYSVALSADGSTLAVSAINERSAATGVDGDQANDAAVSSGAVYVFTRDGATWTQQAYIKPSNTGSGDQFGTSVALSADGSTLAVGADHEDSAATGIGGSEVDNSAPQSGAVYVFTRDGTLWRQQAYVKASNTGKDDRFGHSVALSGDGSTLAVGAFIESSTANGVDGNQADNSAPSSGAVYVFTRDATMWSQQAYVKASNTAPGDAFGHSVALSSDGATLAVGALDEDSAATGVDGNQGSDAAGSSGAVYVFARIETKWNQQAYLKASNTGAGDHFGSAVALTEDGATLVVGAVDEGSAATGVGGDQVDDSAQGAGAVYRFARSDTTWSQQAYIKASNTAGTDQLGQSVALSVDGTIMAMSAALEDSAARGVGGDQASDGSANSGAVYVLP